MYNLTSGVFYKVPEKYVRVKEFRYELGGGNDFHRLSAKPNNHIYIYETLNDRFEIIILDCDDILGKDGDWSIRVMVVQTTKWHTIVHEDHTTRFLEEMKEEK
jgi:hypothetical protein